MRYPTTLRRGSHRPLLPVNLLADDGRFVLIDALIDTGADISLFPQHLAEQLGMALAI